MCRLSRRSLTTIRRRRLRRPAVVRSPHRNQKAEIDPMQNTYPPRRPGNPQKSATPSQLDFLCRNHSTSA